MVNRWWFLLPALALVLGPVHAQNVPLNAIVVSVCGTPNNTYPAGLNRPITMDQTGKLCLNTPGSSGTVTSISNSDGTIVLAPNPITTTGTVSLNLAHANTWTAVQSFTNGDLSLLGSSSGNSILQAPATGGVTATLPAGSGTLVYSSGAVTSIAGTANQITASASTGAVTLSLPSALQPPGTIALGSCTIGTDAFCATGTTSVGAINLTSATCSGTGFYLSATNTIGFCVNGTLRYTASATTISSATSGGPVIIRAASTSTVPSLIPNGTATTTGFGGDGTNLYGIIAGATAVTWAPGGETVSVNGSASNSPLLLNGTIFTGGSGTTTFPAYLIQPTAASAVTTWSTAGTGFGINAPSGFTGNLVDFHVNGGASVFSINSLGSLTASGSITGGNISGLSLTATLNRLALSGNVSAAAWTTSGKGITQSAATWTDTSTASGTLAVEYINLVATPTLAFSNTGVTVTNAYNSYFQSPTAGTNATLTNAWALGTDSLRVNGPISAGGTIPTVTGTGTPTIATRSTDTAGEVTSGSAATSVVITFAASKTNAPFCTVTAQTQLVAFAYTISTTAITITQTATTGEKIDYVCFQN